MKQNQIIEIEWLDTITKSEWMTKKEILNWANNLEIHKDIGYFIGENENYLIIAKSRDNQGEYDEIQKFPKKCILKICQKTIPQFESG